MQHCINTLKMADVRDKITSKLLIATSTGLETLEQCELGLEEVWERECSSDSDVEEVSLTTNRSCHLAAGLVSSRFRKEF